MISLEKSLRQMAWADQKLFEHLLGLPDEAWRAKVVEGEWPVYSYLFHLVASADWYAFELGAKLHFTKEPESIDEVRTLGPIWRELDNFLIEECFKDDEELTYVEDGKEFRALRSTVLSQAVIHAVEHRIHIATALNLAGYELPNLEDFSVWGYVHSLDNSN
jgi:uncharacterized damage-inducible protein DinB